MATILCKNYPQMATVRGGVIKKMNEPYKEDGEREVFYPNIETKSKIRVLEFIEDTSKNKDNLSHAKMILCGGVGLKTQENFKKLEELAKYFGPDCAVGGTRKAVEKGLISKDKQLGQTGKTTAPKLYIAFGVSGAIQHIVGIENSDYIIAINNDPNAQIFENCNYKIVGDAEAVLNSLLNEMKKI